MLGDHRGEIRQRSVAVTFLRRSNRFGIGPNNGPTPSHFTRHHHLKGGDPDSPPPFNVVQSLRPIGGFGRSQLLSWF